MKKYSALLFFLSILFWGNILLASGEKDPVPEKGAGSAARPVNPHWYQEFLPPPTNERIPYQNRYGKGGNKRYGVGFSNANGHDTERYRVSPGYRRTVKAPGVKIFKRSNSGRRYLLKNSSYRSSCGSSCRTVLQRSSCCKRSSCTTK